MAIGLCNIFSSFFKSFAVSCAISGTVIQEKTGGKTQVSWVGFMSCDTWSGGQASRLSSRINIIPLGPWFSSKQFTDFCKHHFSQFCLCNVNSVPLCFCINMQSLITWSQTASFAVSGAEHDGSSTVAATPVLGRNSGDLAIRSTQFPLPLSLLEGGLKSPCVYCLWANGPSAEKKSVSEWYTTSPDSFRILWVGLGQWVEPHSESWRFRGGGLDKAIVLLQYYFPL